VLVQTFTPDHPCITLAAQHNYEEFAKLELAHRKQHRYPPYERMARLIVRSEKEDAAAQFAETLAGAFRAAIAHCPATPRTDPSLPGVASAPPPIRLLGPAECPVFRLNNYYRFHFQVQSESSARLHDVLRTVLRMVKVPSHVEFQVDIDPYSML
jgi:primosomal protein N' (replication factor Y)